MSPRSALVRWTLRTSELRPASIERDVWSRRPGRGAWTCNDNACVQAAGKKRAFVRALRIPSGIQAQLISDFTAHRHSGELADSIGDERR